jgi:tripartite-type tricarboxylate transporter receptor subunit TctC
MTDVLGGQIDGMVTAVSGLITSAQAGKLRALAVTGAERSPALPDVATVREQGLPALLVVNWYAIAGPPNMPPAMANAFNAAIVKTVAVPAVAGKLAAAGVYPKTDASPAVFAAFVRDEFSRWGKVVKDAGIKAE